MVTHIPEDSLESSLVRARALQASRQFTKAEAAYERILVEWPNETEAMSRLASYAQSRGDGARAVELLSQASQRFPTNAQIALDLALAYLSVQQPDSARATLESILATEPACFTAWLLLGELREVQGDKLGALKAWYQAVTRAQVAGNWHDQDSTPPHLLDAVVHAIKTVRAGRRDLFFGAFDDLRIRFGSEPLKRVDRAISAYLGESSAVPPDARQRPRFFYFPDLPSEPYIDVGLQPWTPLLREGFADIRAEALRVFAEDNRFEHFVELKAGGQMSDFVSGTGPASAWEALFFWRHGLRTESTHQRCPRTSEILESIELCRIDGEAPEICFSVLKPGTTILPHHGVSNTRAVMHLPLLVPPNCALNLIGVGEHVWQEGQPMMFDDTFQHEAWNHSPQTRIILLMDCWNPHLEPVEKLAIKQLIETIGGLHRAGQAAKNR